MNNIEKALKKGNRDDLITLSIRSWDNEGRGIADMPDGRICFVKGAIPGETVRAGLFVVKKNYAEAVTEEVIVSSPHRIANGPGLEGTCLSHVDYEGQLEFKYNKVRDCLIRIGRMDPSELDSFMKPIIPADRIRNYRNHMQYRIRQGRICEVRRGSNELVEVTENAIEYKIFGKIRKALEKIWEDAPTNLFDGLVLRGSERTGELLIELVSADTRSHELVIRDASQYLRASDMAKVISDAAEGYRLMGILLRISPDKTSSRTRSGKRVVLCGEDYYTEQMCGRTFRVKAGAFFQVNTEQAEKLYAKASEGLKDAKVLYDVYCGTGSIGLSCIGNDSRLIGIENVREAVESARINAKLSGVSNAEFICRPAEKIVPGKDGLPPPDAVIVDPPRKGMDPVFVRKLMETKPPRISYISCDPATMARDLKYLASEYRIESVTPVDLFCWTEHVETVCLLSNTQRPKKESYITLDVEMEDYYRIKNEGKNSTT